MTDTNRTGDSSQGFMSWINPRMEKLLTYLISIVMVYAINTVKDLEDKVDLLEKSYIVLNQDKVGRPELRALEDRLGMRIDSINETNRKEMMNTKADILSRIDFVIKLMETKK